ncbi:MAG: GTPase Era [Coriobacteriales bacterium]
MTADIPQDILSAPDDLPAGFRSGFVALVGRPNVGKSTLANALVGDKVAITSDTPQTTRSRLRAIVDRDDMQVVLVDTPGLHKPRDPLGSELNRSALGALADVDVVCMLVDASKPIGTGDAWVARQLQSVTAPRLLVLSKSDLVGEKELRAQRDRAAELAAFDDVVALSALSGDNLDTLLDELCARLPEGPRWFPAGTTSDQPLEMLVAEFVREKVLGHTRDEVPYSVGVKVEDLTYDERRDLTSIWAVIYVERDSQKGIIIGSGGRQIKQIGTEARADLVRLLGGRVRLDLTVKVRRNWRRDVSLIHRLGYGDEDE